MKIASKKATVFNDFVETSFCYFIWTSIEEMHPFKHNVIIPCAINIIDCGIYYSASDNDTCRVICFKQL